MKVYHEQFGKGKAVNSTEKLNESGNIISADVMFEHGIEVELPLFEVTYSAKKAAAGKDIGKPGKEFKKIAAKAAAKYGSKAAGGRVAGAILKNLRKEEAGDNSVQIQGTESPTVASTHPDPYKKGHLPKDVKKHGARGQETYGEEAEHIDEKLKGNQNKIDANKNGKIDAEDFKKLRGKKDKTDYGNMSDKDDNDSTTCESVEETHRLTPDSASMRMPAVESVVRNIMSQGRNLRQEAKIAEFKSRNK